MANKRRRQKKRVKIFLNFTYVHKTQPGQKNCLKFSEFFEDIYSPARQMFGYPGLDAGLDTLAGVTSCSH